MTRKKQPKKTSSSDLSARSVALAQFATETLLAAEQLHVKRKRIPNFTLDVFEREMAAELPGLSATLKRKLKQKDATFTVADTAQIVSALAASLVDSEPLRLLKLLLISKKLIDCLQTNVVPAAPIKTKRSKPTATLYQFKITLRGAQPLIWRRILVMDCTLDKLHEHIQTAMGWTNSHLHQFEIQGNRYGDPELLGYGFEELKCIDSTRTNLSQILPKTRRRFAFNYEYDFGDGWEHEVLFEGTPPLDPKAKYPLCLEGERACPPEDCGGVWGYSDFLEAISNKKHEDHKRMVEWIGGSFDPEEFDPARATKAMKKGLPDWRQMV